MTGPHPPADAVTVVRDPATGDLTVPTVLLDAASAWTPAELRDLLARYAPDLTVAAGTDPVVLAALAAVHIPAAWTHPDPAPGGRHE